MAETNCHRVIEGWSQERKKSRQPNNQKCNYREIESVADKNPATINEKEKSCGMRIRTDVKIINDDKVAGASWRNNWGMRD